MKTLALLFWIIAVVLFGLSASRFISDKISLMAAGLLSLTLGFIFLNWDAWSVS